MAKHHKFMWTGVDVETSATPEQIWSAVESAIAEAKGKYTRVTDSELVKAWEIKGSETLFASAPELTFDVQISAEVAGRRAVRTHVLRTLLKDSSIPFGGKTMLGQKAYLKVAQSLGAQLVQVDPTSQVSLREGPMPADFRLDTLTAPVAPPAPAA